MRPLPVFEYSTLSRAASSPGAAAVFVNSFVVPPSVGTKVRRAGIGPPPWARTVKASSPGRSPPASRASTGSPGSWAESKQSAERSARRRERWALCRRGTSGDEDEGEGGEDSGRLPPPIHYARAR